jgi:hypothetical protein
MSRHIILEGLSEAHMNNDKNAFVPRGSYPMFSMLESSSQLSPLALV